MGRGLCYVRIKWCWGKKRSARVILHLASPCASPPGPPSGAAQCDLGLTNHWSRRSTPHLDDFQEPRPSPNIDVLVPTRQFKLRSVKLGGKTVSRHGNRSRQLPQAAVQPETVTPVN